MMLESCAGWCFRDLGEGFGGTSFQGKRYRNSQVDELRQIMLRWP